LVRQARQDHAAAGKWIAEFMQNDGVRGFPADQAS
jgi:hypothetical protein